MGPRCNCFPFLLRFKGGGKSTAKLHTGIAPNRNKAKARPAFLPDPYKRVHPGFRKQRSIWGWIRLALEIILFTTGPQERKIKPGSRDHAAGLGLRTFPGVATRGPWGTRRSAPVASRWQPIGQKEKPGIVTRRGIETGPPDRGRAEPAQGGAAPNWRARA